MKSPIAFLLLLLAHGSFAQRDSLPVRQAGIPQLDWKRDSLAVEAINKEDSLEVYVKAWLDLGWKYDTHGFEYDNRQNQKRAIECFKKILTVDSTNKLVLIYLGSSYWTQAAIYEDGASNDMAMQCFKKVIELDPADTVSWNGLGSCHFLNKNYLEAIECYDKCIAIAPQYGDAYNCRAIAYEALGDLEMVAGNREKAKSFYYDAFADNETALIWKPDHFFALSTRHALTKKLSSLRD